MKYKGYTDLKCYQEARLLRIYISGLSKKLPKTEVFLLTAQILDASRSITSNMAEGYGRFSYLDTRNFFIIARGSTIETMEHLTTAFDERYISEMEFNEGKEKCELVFKLINGFISYLNKMNKVKVSNK